MTAGTLVAYRWEVRKLLAQKRTYIGIGAATLLPIIFVTVMGLQSGGPYDVPLGHNLRRTGLSITVVVLTFASRFGAQLVTALVAGDIVAAEDTNGTLKTIFTRSLRRGQILVGKVLASFTYVLVLLVALGVSGVVSGTIAWGWKPLVTLSQVRISAGHALGLTAAALAVFAMTLAAVAGFALFLSVATRNSAASIVGALVWGAHLGSHRRPRPRRLDEVHARQAARCLAGRLPLACALDRDRPLRVGFGAVHLDPARCRVVDLVRRDVADE